MIKVGYLGPEGTFSEEAGKVYAKKLEGKVEMIPYATFHDLLTDANRNKVDEAVVPIENSIEGTVPAVTDILAQENNLKIKQEIVVAVHQYLVAGKGVKLSEITDVISHPQPLGQCTEYLRKNLPKAKLHLSHSTVEAIKQVATSISEKGIVFAAIGSKAAANLYKLKIIASSVNAKGNETRFLVLAKNDHAKTGHDKSSIVFSVAKNRPGGLYSILGEFADRKINLTKIESRPSKKALGDYFFFVDLDGHRDDALVSEALKNVKKNVAFFKFLGSYPKHK